MVDIRSELKQSERSAWWGVVGNFALMILKIVVGVIGHSQALIADGVHSGADLASSVAVVVGLRISRLPPDDEHNYGHAKAEAVAQKVVAVLLILAGFELGTNAIHLLFHGSTTTPSSLTLAVAAGVMALKEWMYISQKKVADRTGSHALMASARDNRVDVYSSAIAFAAIAGARLGIAHFDQLGAVAVAVLVFWLGVQLFSQAANDLMDRSANPELVDVIQRAAKNVSREIIAVSEVRTRVSGTQVLVDIKIVVDRNMSLLHAHELAHRVREAILTVPRVQDVMVHVNPADAERTLNSSEYGTIGKNS